MTLVLAMSKAEGLYLATDYRVTDARSGKLVDDDAPKHLTIHYPPLDNGGPKALFGYTGIATVRDGTRTGEWLRETLRGESEHFDTSMRHLLDRTNRDFPRAKHPLTFMALVAYGNKRYLGGVTNLERRPDGNVYVRDTFGYSMQELTEPAVFANGSGARHIEPDGHLARLQSQLAVHPRRTMDHMRLLASVNRRVADKDSSVSPFCHVAFVNSDDTTRPQSHAFVEKGENVSFSMPFVLSGVDINDMMAAFQARAEATFRMEEPPPDLSVEEMNARLKRRP
jgi:hypothetical protein